MSIPGFDTPRAAERRRVFDKLERRLVRLALAAPEDREMRVRVDKLRYAISFARLTVVRNADGTEVDLSGVQALHANRIRDLLSPSLIDKEDVREALRQTDEAVHHTLAARRSVLEHMPLSRDALEAEVSEKLLLVASAGGGGVGYVYPGAFDTLDRAGLEPSLMVGTSIGALMSMFRAKRRRFDLAALVAAARTLSWSKVFRVLESESRYGLPATLRLYLRSALGHLFEEDGRPLRLSDMEIPLYTVTTGITVDALKHDLHFYESFLSADVQTSRSSRAQAGLRAMSILREFLSSPDALKEIVLGRTPGTEDFDTLDAAGFSAAIPAVIHYDVLRDDPRMTALLDALYATYGITRLGEGGMVSNLGTRIAWESAAAGLIRGRRNCFVLGLDGFAPSPMTRLAWFPFQQLVRQSNVNRDRQFADLYVPFPRALSPLNLVPPVQDAMQAIRWGREEMEPHVPLLKRMMSPVPTLADPTRPGE